jgi:hypothetical protein
MIWIKDLPESQQASAAADFKRDENLLQQLAFMKEEAYKSTAPVSEMQVLKCGMK